MIYLKQDAEISMARFKSKSIRLDRGVHQACPLSPLFFDLVNEVLAILGITKGITKIENMGRAHKILLYANNIVFILRNPVVSFQNLFGLFRTPGNVSRYKINPNKSALMGMYVDHRIKAEIGNVIKIPWKQ